MKRTLQFFAGFLLIITTITLHSQQYYNYNTAGSSNTFPFGTLPATGKTIQHLYLPGDFNNPSPPSAGNITKIYFRANNTASATYNNIKIRMGLTTDTDLPSGAWYSGPMTIVYDEANVSLSSTAATFFSITLETPFYYDPTKSLVVEIEQCGYSGTGISVLTTSTTGMKRHASTQSTPPPTTCPHAWFNTGAFVTHTGLDIAPPAPAPNYLHYKFENNPSASSVLNCGSPGVGTQVASFTGLTLTSGGQFDSCITGSGVNAAGVVTGWNNSLGTSSWTISMWVDLPTTTFGYVFGDGGGSFRCFNNGAAPSGGITLRGTGIANVDVPGFNAGPVVVHFVYDSAASNIKVYKNGVLSLTVPQTPLNLTAGTGFKVGGYTTVAGFTGKLDEFRLYRRALDSTEILATFNQDIACAQLVPVTGNNNQIPKEYLLEQNYPNPFNPVTNINFSIPKTGFTEIKIFDALGREVAVLHSSYTQAGSYSVKFDASSLSSGVYFYTLKSGEFTATKKMALIK